MGYLPVAFAVRWCKKVLYFIHHQQPLGSQVACNLMQHWRANVPNSSSKQKSYHLDRSIILSCVYNDITFLGHLFESVEFNLN